jgi:hypothetical protein
MIARLLEVQEPLERAWEYCGKEPHGVDWEALASIHRLLKPFSLWTTKLQAEYTVTISAVAPAWDKLGRHLQAFIDTDAEHADVKDMARRMQARLNSERDHIKPDCQLLRLCCLLVSAWCWSPTVIDSSPLWCRTRGTVHLGEMQYHYCVNLWSKS